MSADLRRGLAEWENAKKPAYVQSGGMEAVVGLGSKTRDERLDGKVGARKKNLQLAIESSLGLHRLVTPTPFPPSPLSTAFPTVSPLSTDRTTSGNPPSLSFCLPSAFHLSCRSRF